MSEITIDKWKEPVYIEKLDITKGNKLKRFFLGILFIFSPEHYAYYLGLREVLFVKVLNTKTREVRVIKV